MNNMMNKIYPTSVTERLSFHFEGDSFDNVCRNKENEVKLLKRVAGIY